jgi:ubiquinone/menaquinone biosynthesis C-methylase UbiE
VQNVSALDFQFFLLRFGIKRFIDGFYYFKWLEYPLVYNNLELHERERYLDIGSGKSIFPLFVLQNKKCNVHIIDDESIINDSINYYRKIIKEIKLEKTLKYKFFIHRANNGIKLDFPNNYFDKISCISTLEHIKEDGDSIMMKTIARILRKGGRAIITFPFNSLNYIEEENPKEVGYFQRRYNFNAIKQRIIEPSGLKLKRAIYFGERYVKFGKLYLENKFQKFHWLLPLFYYLFWRVCYSHDGDTGDIYETKRGRREAGVACLILEK